MSSINHFNLPYLSNETVIILCPYKPPYSFWISEKTKEFAHGDIFEVLQLAPRNCMFPEKPPVAQLLSNLAIFYGIWRFIVLSTRSIHWSTCRTRWIQSVSLHPIFPRFILILFFHLRLDLPSGLFPFGFPTKILHAFLLYRSVWTLYILFTTVQHTEMLAHFNCNSHQQRLYWLMFL
jgi:hypothetical protein